jgi:hypothetical protein
MLIITIIQSNPEHHRSHTNCCGFPHDGPTRPAAERRRAGCVWRVSTRHRKVGAHSGPPERHARHIPHLGEHSVLPWGPSMALQGTRRLSFPAPAHERRSAATSLSPQGHLGFFPRALDIRAEAAFPHLVSSGNKRKRLFPQHLLVSGQTAHQALSASAVTMLKAIVQHRADRQQVERHKFYFLWLARQLRKPNSS